MFQQYSNNIVFSNFTFFILGMIVVFTFLLTKPLTKGFFESTASFISPVPQDQLIPNR